jgi:hypothetical protein
MKFLTAVCAKPVKKRAESRERGEPILGILHPDTLQFRDQYQDDNLKNGHLASWCAAVKARPHIFNWRNRRFRARAKPGPRASRRAVTHGKGLFFIRFHRIHCFQAGSAQAMPSSLGKEGSGGHCKRLGKRGFGHCVGGRKIALFAGEARRFSPGHIAI